MSSGSLFLIISSLLASSSTRADAFSFFPPITTTTATPASISNNDNCPNYHCHLRKATQLNLFQFVKGKGGNANNQDNNNKADDNSKQPHNNMKYSPLEDEPWKNDDSYWDMLQKASKDPETFEKFIEESVAKKKLGRANSMVSSSSTAAAGVGTASSEGGESSSSPPKKRGAYQRIEEWDAQRKNGDGNGMSEEERLQWECQKMGNQFRQNEILRHHLNSF
mmetsp:Transcript_28428/g.56763  ORF Transcript_28428/g.56763 Transcript_28428/m.56763 type:complete len:222 (-) Transcript_28428:423-1088(-)